MSEWIKQICATVLIIMIIILLLPDSKIGKFIKGILPLFLSIVIIKPIINVTNMDFSELFTDNGVIIEVQQDFISKTDDKKVENRQKNCYDFLKNYGINDAIVKIEYNSEIQKIGNEKKIVIDLTNAVIKSDKSHIDIIERVKQGVASLYDIDVEKVEIYE